jgi:hypothetical protein
MNKKGLLIIYLSCLLAMMNSSNCFSRPKCLCLTWAFVIEQGGSPSRILDVSQHPVINPGDRLRLLIEPMYAGIYFYVFRIDTHDDLTILRSSVADRAEIVLPQEPK